MLSATNCQIISRTCDSSYFRKTENLKDLLINNTKVFHFYIFRGLLLPEQFLQDHQTRGLPNCYSGLDRRRESWTHTICRQVPAIDNPLIRQLSFFKSLQCSFHHYPSILLFLSLLLILYLCTQLYWCHSILSHSHLILVVVCTHRGRNCFLSPIRYFLAFFLACRISLWWSLLYGSQVRCKLNNPRYILHWAPNMIYCWSMQMKKWKLVVTPKYPPNQYRETFQGQESVSATIPVHSREI